MMGRLNHHSVDNNDVNFQTLGYPFGSTSDSVPDTDTTPTKSIGDSEMDQLVEISHPEHYDNMLDAEL